MKIGQGILRVVSLYALLAIASLLLSRCANEMAPTGGPKDTKPPTVVSENPPNFSTQFQTNRIRVSFDEFIGLDNPIKNILVSPPLEKNPDIRVKGRGFEIHLKDSLKPSTTYTIYFSDAIADITEGNKVRNYSYVFSTGEEIDTYGLKGRVIDAFTGKPEEGIAVMLYLEEGDSPPMKSRPWYLSRSNAGGDFEFRNIGAGPYVIYALSDANGNYLYDMPNEKIAFNDSLLIPYELEAVFDTITGKTSFFSPKDEGLVLRSFTESAHTPKVLRIGMAMPALAEVLLNRPGSYPTVRDLHHHETDVPMRLEMSDFGDSLKVWLFSPLPDTLNLEVSVAGQPIDTGLILPSRAVSASGRQAPKLQLQATSLVQGKHRHLHDFIITASYPILNSSDSSLLMTAGDDSIPFPVSLRAIDSTLQRRFRVDYPWKEGTKYSLQAEAGAFTSINGLESDSMYISFSTFAASDLGNLKLTLNDSIYHEPLVLELLDKGGNLISRVRLEAKTRQTIFKQLLPGEYLLRVIFDENGNGFWDPGTLSPPKQAEKVFNYNQPVSIKANWDLDLEWKF